MKLNNHGWGYRQMLLMSSILLMFLLVAAYNIYSLYVGLDTKDAMIYANLETKLELAAAEYINGNALHHQKNILSLRDLNEYISSFEDDEGRNCDGYVIYENYDYKAYINCPKYTTVNYNEIYE